MFYGNPDNLDQLAGSISVLAERVRDHTWSLVQRTSAIQWESTAADLFRQRVDLNATRLADTATELDAVAAVIRVHAQTVRQHLQEIHRIEQTVTSWLAAAPHLAEDAAEGAALPVLARLPAPGSKEWLHVGDTLRRMGVVV